MNYGSELLSDVFTLGQESGFRLLATYDCTFMKLLRMLCNLLLKNGYEPSVRLELVLTRRRTNAERVTLFAWSYPRKTLSCFQDNYF